MSPTHANKRGARYRYYVSQAVLQRKAAGGRHRSPACRPPRSRRSSLRRCATTCNASGAGEQLPDNDRDLLERHLERVTLDPEASRASAARSSVEARASDDGTKRTHRAPPHASVTTITVPWTSPVPAAVKGIIHVPAHNTPMKPSRRETLC